MHHRTQLTLSSVLALTIVFGACLVFPWGAQAQDDTTSPSAELREIIRQRIEETIQEKNSAGPAFIGTLGTVTKVSSSTFSLTDTLGRERTVEMTSDTALLIDGEDGELTDISINSGAVVMGTARDEVIITARRVLIQDEDFSESREVLLGTVTEKATGALVISTRGTKETYALDIVRDTTYEDSLGNAISLSDVQEDQSVLLITDLDRNDERYVSRLRLLVPVESLETDE